MARIPADELARLKREISLERLVEAKGIALKKHGQDLIGHCPFHPDKTPSLVISPKKNLWHCLGACQTGGSDWVMKAEGVSFRHAVELLREMSPSLAAALGSTHGRPAEDGRTHMKRSTVTHLKSAVPSDVDAQGALQRAIAYYHESLKSSPEALAYLEKRGLKSSALIDRFKLGFCDRTLCYRLPKKNRKDGAAIRASLHEAGILRESGHEHFRGSLVIPVFDDSGRVVEVYGRRVRDNLRAGTPRHLYLPGPHRGVWNLEAVQHSKEIILCESLIDALTFWVHGFRHVTASYGIEGFTDEHLAALKTYGVERVLIAYDRDEAGEKAAQRLGERLVQEGLSCFQLKFPLESDANQYARDVTPARKGFEVLLRNAHWLGSGNAPAIEQLTALEPVPESVREVDAAPEPRSPELLEEATESQPPSSALAADSEPESRPEPELPPESESKRGPESLPEPEPKPVPDSESLPKPEPHIDVSEEEVILRFAERRWRVRGLHKNMAYDVLKVNVLCSRGEAFHVDTLDLYAARHRMSFLAVAAQELACDERVLKRDLGAVLLKLEALQDAQIQAALNPADDVPEMDETQRAEALALLGDPQLLERLLTDFDALGLVGEKTNKLCGYLAAVSRKLPKPLAVLVQSTSAAGKSSLMEAVLALVPAEERGKYSAMTGQSLFYMGETNLKHKILAIVEEEGAERASYALKLLQSEGELVIASTGKEPTSGRLVTHEYRVEGPVMIFLTTTAIDIDEELLNRCLVLTVDEAREQTQAIHREQRSGRTLEGLKRKGERERLRVLHQNAQRLLRPLAVVNPFAEALQFPDERTRTRRDHEKYLTLIDAIALLHQHQRPVKQLRAGDQMLDYIEVTESDIATANTLAMEVLARSLDELPPQTRRMLEAIESWVTARAQAQAMDRGDVRFSRRDVREATGLGMTQVGVHMERLVRLELLSVFRGMEGSHHRYGLAQPLERPQALALVDIATTPTPRTHRGPNGVGAVGSKPLNGNGNSGTHRGVGELCSRAAASHAS